MQTDLSTFCVGEGSCIRDAVRRMDVNRRGIVMVVDDGGRLVGTVTDGDVRRALLAQVDLSAPVSTLLARKAGTRYARPITAPAGADRGAILRLFQEHRISHLPLVDGDGRVVSLVTSDEFIPREVLPLQAVIMAGGAGTRLRPLTEDTPKPMLPVGERPLMEIVLERLRDAGIKRVSVTTHHQSDNITDHFGDGRRFGVELSYVAEDQPLGTAGGIGLLDRPTDTLLVMNGDILTEVDFRAMHAYHREHHADLTVALRQYDLRVPYGVVECDGPTLLRVTEKPVLSFFVNAGIYLLEPVVHGLIAPGERLDMTELIQRLIDRQGRVVGFPVLEYWLDIGEHADYARAQQDASVWSAQR